VRRQPPEVVTFTVADLGEVVARMEALAPAVGWLVLQPAFDAGATPPRRSAGFFSSRGPYVPVASWVPGERTRQGIDYTAVGVQHGAGSAVADLLEERGHAVPTGWEVVDDHPGRGLVVAVPPATAHVDVLGWLVDTADHLCPVQLTGEWRATVHRR
jgi:hypothetical protein